MDQSDLGRALQRYAHGKKKRMTPEAIEQRRKAGIASWSPKARAKRKHTLQKVTDNDSR